MPAFSREAYQRHKVRGTELLEHMRYLGARRLFRTHLKMGLEELLRAFLTLCPLFISAIACAVPQPTSILSYHALELPPPFNAPEREYSGLAWWNDTLILLPQYPEQLSHAPGRQGAFVQVHKKDLIHALRTGEVVAANYLPVQNLSMPKIVPGYEGFEALAIRDDRAVLAIESKQGSSTFASVVTGRFSQTKNEFVFDSRTAVQVPLLSRSWNRSVEAIIPYGNSLFLLEEVSLNVKGPVAHCVHWDLSSCDALPFPRIPYRLTDATPADAQGYFWAINYLWPGDLELRGQIKESVERLLEFRILDGAITQSTTPPRYLPLASEGRNWEGIAPFTFNQQPGWLIVTDRFPETILAFVSDSNGSKVIGSGGAKIEEVVEKKRGANEPK